jgi:diacylglycerol kinase (ATP)
VTTQPYFIVNPASGGGRTRNRLPGLQHAAERLGIDGDFVTTRARGEAFELAANAIAAGRETLVACGGDGTLYEVANAILQAGAGEQVRLGTVGMGTGKDAARCLGLPTRVSGLKAVAAGHERRVDAGRISLRDESGAPLTRYFLVEASAGWVPEISQSVPRRLKLLGDTAPYVIMTVAKMAGPMNREFLVTIDGEQFDGPYNSVSVHNVAYWGGDLLAVPGASTSDGLLDVVRWGALGRRTVLKAVDGQRKGGTHMDIDGIDHHRAVSISLSSPKQSVVDLDGEKGGYLPAEISVVPGALRFLAPPE